MVEREPPRVARPRNEHLPAMQDARAVLQDCATAIQAMDRILAAARTNRVTLVGLDPLRRASDMLQRVARELGRDLDRYESHQRRQQP